MCLRAGPACYRLYVIRIECLGCGHVLVLPAIRAMLGRRRARTPATVRQYWPWAAGGAFALRAGVGAAALHGRRTRSVPRFAATSQAVE